jgi:hypothetical protein
MKITKTIIAILLISFIATSCASGSKFTGNCKGNKTMSYYQGYSRKAFKF